MATAPHNPHTLHHWLLPYAGTHDEAAQLLLGPQGTLELPADPVQWLVKDLIKIDKNRVAFATVTHPDGEVLKVVRGPRYATLIDCSRARMEERISR